VRIAGHFELGTGFAADGAVLMSDHGLCRTQPGRTLNDVSLGLVRLDAEHQSGDVETVAQAIADWLPDDVEVLTRERACQDEAYHWVWNTSIGWIFFLGVLLAMVVGTIIVYLILSNDVANHLAEYATLKAMGYTESYLAGIVLQQAVTLALVGFVPGWIMSAWLYSYARSVARLPINMELRWVMAVLVLTVVMCVLSGLGSMRKLHSANPAELF
jgi:putative ABC transport system permease protein